MAEIAQELMKSPQFTKLKSTPAQPRGNGVVERQNRTLTAYFAPGLYVALDSTLGRAHQWSLGRLHFNPT